MIHVNEIQREFPRKTMFSPLFSYFCGPDFGLFRTKTPIRPPSDFSKRSLRRTNACGTIRATKTDGEKHVMEPKKIFAMKLSKVYPLLVSKAEKKNRTKQEVDEIICWLTGYDLSGLEKQLGSDVDYGTFFRAAPCINPNCAQIKGVICGVRVEEIEDPLMQKIRYLDKLVDALAKGRLMEKILRSQAAKP